MLRDFSDRPFTSIDYFDKDAGWCQFNADVDVSDFEDIPQVRITFAAPMSKFHFSQFEKTSRHRDRRALRIPQQEALEKLRVQLYDNQQREFWVCMPTGSGKTLVMSLAPFMLNVDRVLVLAPGKTIRDQDYDNLSATYTNQFKGITTVILHQYVELPRYAFATLLLFHVTMFVFYFT